MGAPPAAASTDTRQPGPGHRPPAQSDTEQRDCLRSLLAVSQTRQIKLISRFTGVNFPKKLLFDSCEDHGPLSGLEMYPGVTEDGVLWVLWSFIICGCKIGTKC